MTGMAQPAKGANGVSPGKISESKLTFRVRRFLDAEAGNGRKVTELVVLEHLLHTYREYQRKPQVLWVAPNLCYLSLIWVTLPAYNCRARSGGL